MFRPILGITASLLAVTLALPAHAAKTTLSLGTTESGAGEAARELDGLVKHVDSSSNVSLAVKAFPTLDAAYAAFKQGKIDLLLVGPVKYVEAHNDLGAIAVVAEEPKVQHSYIVTRKGSPLKSVADLKGKKFAFGYADSTSTHLMPLLILSKHQIAEKDLGKTGFLGAQQDKIVDSVIGGEYDAGAVTTAIYEQNKARLQLLEESEPYPGAVIAAHKNMDPKVVQQVRDAVVAYKPAGPLTALRFGHGGAKIEDEEFNKVRFLCKVLFKKTYH